MSSGRKKQSTGPKQMHWISSEEVFGKTLTTLWVPIKHSLSTVVQIDET